MRSTPRGDGGSRSSTATRVRAASRAERSRVCKARALKVSRAGAENLVVVTESAEVPRLARLWDERLRRDMSRFDLPAPEVLGTSSLLSEPASEEAIQRAEERLAVDLPPTYRAFLRTSNGAYASSLGPELQHWGETSRHGFLPVERVRRLVDCDDGPFLIGIWTDEEVFMNPERYEPPVRDELTEVSYYAPMREALLISEPMDVFKDLLVPCSGSDGWEVWQLAKEGASAYRNFAAFLSNQINRPDRRPIPELADLYVAEIRDGKRHRLHDLAEIGDPRVAPLAFAYMLDPSVGEFWKRGWAEPVGKVADPADAADLRRVYEQATMGDFRMELLHALIRCGDPDIEETVRRIASDPNDHAHRWATFVLPRLHAA